jgi:hypothetical protein
MLRVLSKSSKGWLACLTAGLLLFTQLAMSAEACMLAKSSPAPQAMAECDGAPMDNGVCLPRCLAGEQAAVSLDHHAPFVLPSVSIGTASFALAESRASLAHVAAFHVPRGPPLRILFCSYQT